MKLSMWLHVKWERRLYGLLKDVTSFGLHKCIWVTIKCTYQKNEENIIIIIIIIIIITTY